MDIDSYQDMSLLSTAGRSASPCVLSHPPLLLSLLRSQLHSHPPPPVAFSTLCCQLQHLSVHEHAQGACSANGLFCEQSFRNPKSLELLDQARDTGGHREQNPISGILAEPPGDDDTPIPKSEGMDAGLLHLPAIASCTMMHPRGQ